MELKLLLDQAAAAGRHEELETAAGLYEQALKSQPGSKAAATGLGICLQKLGRIGQAMPYLAAMANEGAEDPAVYVSLGSCYFKIGKLEPAITAFRRAVNLAPAAPESLVLLAHALARRGQTDEAESCLLGALKLDSQLATAHDLMAYLLPKMGRFDEAKEYARAASSLEPTNAAYASRLVFGGKVSEKDDDLIGRLKQMAASGTLSASDRIRVAYALGKAMEDLGSFEASLRYYVEANAISYREQKRQGHGFDALNHRREIDLLMETYSEANLGAMSATGSESELPVFIVGMMRSGTTLTEQILSSHPEVGAAGELDFWIRAAPVTFNAVPAQIQKISGQYLQLLANVAPGKARVCDKMPQNYMSLGPIHAALPRARIIHCRRDPRDTCFSIFTIPFTFHPPFAYSMKNVASTYRQYQRVMDHWRKVIPSDRFIEVEYEELVTNQETVSRRLIDFLGLEWNDACLFPERNERVVETPSRWQVRQPVYNSSIGRWKRFAPWLPTLLDEWKFTNDL